MTIVHFARHGETVWHVENRYTGITDVALTARGLEQANRLARWATRQPIRRVMSSHLSRAVRTAEPSARALGLPLERDARFGEANFGRAEGRTSAEIRAEDSKGWADFVASPALRPLGGGESGSRVVTRMCLALGDVLAEGAETLVVAHSTALRETFCHLLGAPIDEYRRKFPSLGNCSITSFELPNSARTFDDLAATGVMIEFDRPTV